MANLKKYVLQWYWTWDWLNRKCKAWYVGPKLDWMKEVKEPKSKKKEKIFWEAEEVNIKELKRSMRNENKKKKTQK